MRDEFIQKIVIDEKEYEVYCEININALIDYEEQLNMTKSYFRAFQTMVFAMLVSYDEENKPSFSSVDIAETECKKVHDKLLELDEDFHACYLECDAIDIYEKIGYVIENYIKKLIGSNYDTLKNINKQIKGIYTNFNTSVIKNAYEAIRPITKMSLNLPTIPSFSVPSSVMKIQEISNNLHWMNEVTRINTFSMVNPTELSRLSDAIARCTVNNGIFSDYTKSVVAKASEALSSRFAEISAAVCDMKKLNEKVLNIPLLQLQSQIALLNKNVIESVKASISIPLAELIENNKFGITIDQIEEDYSKIMLLAHWVPYAHSDMEIDVWFHILRIKSHSKTDNSFANNLDRYMYARYTNEKLDNLKRTWNQCENNKHRLRLMKQAVDAHKKRQYGLAIAGLTMVWDGIIEEKVEQYFSILKAKGNKIKSKEKMYTLVDNNGLKEALKEYYDKFIMYQCWGIDEVKIDAPGRNATAHGWFKVYPTRKASLNAILFTDILLHMSKL